MKKQQAIKLLDETFNTNFQMDSYAKFIKELFNVVRIKLQDKTPFIANQYRDYVSKFQKISSYKDSSRKKMEVLAVKLKKTSSRDRARTMQRNFIANWLGKMDLDAALVAFYGDDPEDWRFSFVKMEYNLLRDESGKVKIAKELTPAKRYSYLVGMNEPNHTCRSQFLDLVMDENTKPSVENIEMAFSIDNVTKEFFEKYKELVFDLKKSLEKLVKRDAIIRKEFEEKGITTIDFAKKLLGQIVFIYFLQKKGWLGVGKNKDGTFKNWGFGPKNFLRRLYDKKIVPYENFFNDILEPLFYEALSTERDDDYYSRFKCKIPFLNGGLFEPINDYDWTGTDIIIDNSAFEKILKVFDRFNFTVKEDEPLEREVAVDPEMLGKVFENLLEVKERKDKGAFYTPREIVHYMCQQSLINYLETNTDISREEIEKFIRYGDLALDQTIRALEQKKMYFGKTYDIKEEFLIPPSIQDSYQTIDQLLRDIKIVDPAVGSGAFPIGMMNEIVKARSILTIYFGPEEQEERTEYNFKRETIENSLYGVDIEPSAVEIAKLRFWLSLIVDEGDMKNIKPLPNLDHKIMCGNSLLEEFEGIKLFDETLLEPIDEKTPDSFKIEQIDNKIGKMYVEMANVARGISKSRSIRQIEKEINKLKRQKEKLLFSKKDDIINLTLEESLQRKRRESQSKLVELKKLQKKYFNEQNRKTKKQLREDVDRIEWELIKVTLKEQGNNEAMEKLEKFKKSNAKPFFLWKLYFAEVFQRENPGFDVVIANPPYVDSENMVKEMPKLRISYTELFISAKGNWDLFIIFIEQGLNLLRKKGDISYIVPNKLIGAKYSETLRKILVKKKVTEIRDYSGVNVFKEADVYPITFVISNKEPDGTVLMTLMNSINEKENQNIIPGDLFYADIDWGRYFVGDKRFLDILLKMNEKQELSKYFPNVSGAATVNQAYKLKKILKDTNQYSSGIKKFINTGTIDPYISLWGQKKTRYIKEGYMYPIVLESELEKFSDSRYNQACSEKIIIGGMTKNLECYYDSSEYLAGKSTTIILSGESNLKYLTALLNSKLISFWYKIFFKSLSLSGGYLRISNNEIKRIPLAFPSEVIQQNIISIVNKILLLTEDEGFLKNYEKNHKVKQLKYQIDQLVYKIYKLTPEEIQIVEEFS